MSAHSKKTKIALRPKEFRAARLKSSAFRRSTLVNPGQPWSTPKTFPRKAGM
jgi:hypothetical protein